MGFDAAQPPAKGVGLAALKRPLQWLLGLGLVLLLVRYLVQHADDVRVALESLRGLSVWAWALLVAVVILNDVINAVKYYAIVREAGERVPLWPFTRIFIISRLIGMLMPQGSTLYRGVAMKQQFGIRLRDYASMGIAFVWLNVAFSLLLSLVLLLVLRSRIPLLGVDARWLLAVVCVLALGGPLLAAPLVGRLKPRPGGLVNKLVAGLGALLKLLGSYRLFGIFLVMTVLNYVSSYLTFYLICKGIGLEPDPGGLVLVITCVKCSMLLNITPGNIGIIEILSGYVVSQWGGTMVQGQLISLVVRVFNFLGPFLFSLLFGVREVQAFMREQRVDKESGIAHE